ncbi:DnaJ sub C member 24 [Coemansia sp. BCRC 34301]|nr:DnaJ sub C member 24 [Coemansia sp. BCRC 34301]
MFTNAMDHYSALGVRCTATPEEIKQAYYALSRKIHPDKRQTIEAATSDNKAAKLEFHQIAAAWETLGDPCKRREYDRMQSAEQNRARGVVQDEVDLDDMELDDEDASYSYPCRCSGRYVVMESDLEACRDIAPCSDCSLKIRVLFNVAEDGE